MFAQIHKNLQTDKIAMFISKATFHRWLNGGSPHLWHLSALDAALKTNTTIAYARTFTNIAKQLASTNELAKVSEILSNCSSLEDDDKVLLGNHHKNRIWRNSKVGIND